MESVNMTAVIITALICVTVIILAKIGNRNNDNYVPHRNNVPQKDARQQSK